MRAQRYTLESWMPVNPVVYRRVKRCLQESRYATADRLWADLKQDFSLLLWSVRRAHEQLSKGPRSALDPYATVRSTMVSDFDRLLPKNEKVASAHIFEALTPYQARRLEQAVIAAYTTELLAETARCDAAQLFFISMMRSLGGLLVAWNYPRIYEKALAYQQQNGGELDELLTSILGYSPRLLSNQVASVWNLDQELQQLIGADKTNREGIRGSEREQSVAFLEIGETFSTALAAEGVVARQQLDWVKGQLAAMLGPSAVRLIRERVSLHMADYTSVLPERFDGSLLDDRSVSREIPAANKALMAANQHIQQCVRPVQDSFAKVYRHMVENRPSPPSIRLLITELIPRAGFHHGCIYLPDADVGSLVPKISIGEVPKEEFQPTAQFASAGLTLPVSKAFMGTALVSGIANNASGKPVLYMAQAIGTGGKKGVLYLESDAEKFVTSAADPVPYFNAIHRGLSDALNIKASAPANANKVASSALFVR